MPANPRTVAADLLDWYDAHARRLPWRARPGETADPYRVWLSEIMLQQTTVATVTPRFIEFTTRWPDFTALAAADEAELMSAWAGLGYYARARNLVACARAVVERHGGAFPADEAALRALPGIGDYTSAAIAAIAFGLPATVVDGNVERVVSRLFAIDTPLPSARPAIRAAAATLTPASRPGDYAQAMMDLGATVCTPRSPRCLACPIATHCAGYASGAPERFPVKPAKKAKPARHGTIFWATRGQSVLLVRRPARGLLGGMRALPTGPWTDTPPGLADAPFAADWRLRNAMVRHVFTHFTLDLALASAAVAGHIAPEGGEWWPIESLDNAGLPTVFAKAAAVMTGRN